MASGYEKIECGVRDPNLGWSDGAEPNKIANAFWMVFAIVVGGLNLWGTFLGIRFLLGF